MTVDVNKHLERAKRYLERNKLEDAVEAYQVVLEAAPTHQEAMQALGDLYIRLDKPDRAATYYGLLFDRVTAEAMQLYIEYDPQPPFDSGSLEKAGQDVRDRAAELRSARRG